MDTLNATKRKKRKTRKCLDEIRKRSRRTEQILLEKDNDKHEDNMYSKNIQNCMITNNRLTLRMFPKAVQSKIITRPALHLEHKTKINELSNDTTAENSHNTTRVRIPLNHIFNNNDLFKNKKCTPENCNLESPELESDLIRNTEDKENFELFSSMDELVNKSPTNSLGTPSVSTITSSSSQGLPEDHGYTLYEEFMSEVPACLQQNSKLIQEDIMKKTKMLLQNLYIESCYQECEDNILNCIKNDTINNKHYKPSELLHNPMDYIKLAHMQQHCQFHNISGSHSCSGSSSQSPHRPSSLTSASDTPLSVIIHDTPDYTYYPHRLN